MAKARFEPGLTRESTSENAPVLTDGRNPRRDGALDQQDGFGKMQWPPLNRWRRSPGWFTGGYESRSDRKKDDEGDVRVRDVHARGPAHFVVILIDVGAGARRGVRIHIRS